MTPRLTYAQRKERIEAKIARFQASGDAGEYRSPALPSHRTSVRGADHVSHSGRRRRGVGQASFLVLMWMLCVFVAACMLALPASKCSMRMLCEETKKRACVASAPSFSNWSDFLCLAPLQLFCRRVYNVLDLV